MSSNHYAKRMNDPSYLQYILNPSLCSVFDAKYFQDFFFIHTPWGELCKERGGQENDLLLLKKSLQLRPNMLIWICCHTVKSLWYTVLCSIKFYLLYINRPICCIIYTSPISSYINWKFSCCNHRLLTENSRARIYFLLLL